MTSPTPVLSPALSAAWQAALAAEHQAFFGYGVVAAHLVDTPRAEFAAKCSSAHGDEITEISEAMIAKSLTPVGPLADYPALFPVKSAKDAEAVAARLEDDCTAARRALFAALTSSSGAAKDFLATTQEQLNASAVRAMRWRRFGGIAPLTTAFPGL